MNRFLGIFVTMINFKKMTEDLINIAKVAGDKIMEVYDSGDFDIKEKEDDSPVTIADKKANEIICSRLLKLYPDIPIISEEELETPYSIRKNYDYCWIIDPLDGTKDFINKNGEFTVNIALVKEGKPILGIVHLPAHEKTYWGLKNEGAFCEFKSNITPIKVSTFNLKQENLRVVCSRSHFNQETADFIDTLNRPQKISIGSSLKFLLLAEGNAELYPRLGPCSEWDTAAPQIIIEEAGGKLFIFGTENPLVYNKENLLNPHFLAMGKLDK